MRLRCCPLLFQGRSLTATLRCAACLAAAGAQPDCQGRRLWAEPAAGAGRGQPEQLPGHAEPHGAGGDGAWRGASQRCRGCEPRPGSGPGRPRTLGPWLPADCPLHVLHSRQLHSAEGTQPIQRAPPCLPRWQTSRASDVYAFGIMLWELYTGSRPYEGVKRSQVGAETGSFGGGMRGRYRLGQSNLEEMGPYYLDAWRLVRAGHPALYGSYDGTGCHWLPPKGRGCCAACNGCIAHRIGCTGCRLGARWWSTSGARCSRPTCPRRWRC